LKKPITKVGRFCDKCGEAFTLAPAIFLSPPTLSGDIITSQKRFCNDCYDKIMQWIREDIVTTKTDVDTDMEMRMDIEQKTLS